MKLWIDFGEAWQYYDCKPTAEALGLEKPESVVELELTDEEAATYTTIIEAYAALQNTLEFEYRRKI